ncbi:Insulin-like receptor [Eufriesea mexicana]|uniref:Insulin-like receptor n=1 Tax=Eufriesea mexicana TaxID=516756 RepID=A0A310SLA0_9HYME|nr:PREDICTED: mast/stem cell growth factor receptor kita-like [Eufriesea mexicana]OAD57872.1 Insulin-like receptor [Eufriesea mexicana]
MLMQIQSLLLYSTLISFYLCIGKHAENTNEVVGIVRNLTVNLIQDSKYIGKQDAYKFLRLNISWLPPNSIRQPSFYSIIVRSISIREKTNTSECPEGSLFYTLRGNKKFNVLLPEYNSLVDVSDLYLHPNCSYKVQVFANPRTKYSINTPEVLYTVPKCLDHTCSCINAETTLPTPKVNVSQSHNQMVVNWTSTFNTFNVQSYIISIGIPLFMSRSNLSVYNITRIAEVPANKTMFIWNLKFNNQDIQIKDGYKIIVNAVNYHKCSGPKGSFIIHFTPLNTKNVNHKMWFILIGIIASLILFGILSFVLYHNYNFFVINQNNSSIKIHKISECRSHQWTESILQKHNILYIKHESKEDYMKEIDELKVPFKSVKLIRELGTGHFGKVYLGQLDDKNNTLVAVKMSQQIDMSTNSETRQQFIKEIEIMKMTGNHPHLVRLIGCCIEPSEPICIVLEYMQGGDLLTYLHQQRLHQSKIICHKQSNLQELNKSDFQNTLYNTICSTILNKTNNCKSRKYTNITNNYRGEAIDEKNSWIGKIKRHQFLKFATEIAMGMVHLEAKGITHRDLAARNILLNADLTLKISDFGLSRNGVYVIKNAEEKTRHLPIRWMSPEALNNRAFSSKSDVWSFGIVLWEISTLGDFPYSNIQDDCLLRYIIHENGRLEQPDNVPSNIYKLMHSCWTTEPDNRPNFTQLLSELQILITSLDNNFWTISNPCYVLPF